MRSPTYPVFLKDRDSWIFTIRSQPELESYLESIDVEDQEYAGWDKHGYPVQPILNSGKIELKVLTNTPEPDSLRVAILRYAQVVRPKIVLPDSAVHLDTEALFELVERLIKANRPWHRIKRLFTGKW